MSDQQVGNCSACNLPVYQKEGRCACGNWFDMNFVTNEQVNVDSQTSMTEMDKEEGWHPMPSTWEKAGGKTFSDGSTADYYDFPPNLTKLQDLIAFLDCNAQMGEIGRAWMRYGRCGHSERRRDLRKIIFYANAEIDRLDTYYPEQK